MFVQVIEARVRDPEALRRQWGEWHAQQAAHAVGWLGSTAGITPDRRFVAVVRFSSAQTAAQNARRPEQDAWWSVTREALEEVTFYESSEWSVLGEGNDDAGFVQVMHGRAVDRRRLQELDAVMEHLERSYRPDVIGSYQIWLPGDTFVAVTYFTSEAEARAGESQALPDDLAQRVADWQSSMDDVRWYDLPDPWLHSPA
jgi:hypothetical protein